MQQPLAMCWGIKKEQTQREKGRMGGGVGDMHACVRTHTPVHRQAHGQACT